VPHPTSPERFGLKNLTEVPWSVTMPDGVQYTVGPRQAVELVEGTAINTPTVKAVVQR
jgi:hypothetical protein